MNVSDCMKTESSVTLLEDIDSFLTTCPAELRIDQEIKRGFFNACLAVKWPFDAFRFIFEDFSILKGACAKLNYRLKNIEVTSCGIDEMAQIEIKILCHIPFEDICILNIEKDSFKKLADEMMKKLVDEAFKHKIEKDLMVFI